MAVFGSRFLPRALAVVAVMATLGFAKVTASNEHQLCKGFLPENNMYIPVGAFTTGGLTEDQFNAVIDRLEKIYTPDVTALGDTLHVNRRWTDGTVNASAMRQGSTEVLNMYGGLARHPSITVEGFALVICHEMGHHLGGAPKVDGWFGPAWATNEGGADYFASLKCLRRFFAEDDNATIISTSQIDPVAEAGCNAQYQTPEEQNVCKRISLASQSVADLFYVMKKDPTPPNFGTPDKRQVAQTDDDHPQTQCRLDTMLAGALCAMKISDPLSNNDYHIGTCFSPRDAVGFRPRCWFAPNASDANSPNNPVNPPANPNPVPPGDDDDGLEMF